MTPEALAIHYGLIAIFVGAGIEGEAVMLTGGLLVQNGLLPFWGVALAGAAGSFLVDQGWFWLGRHFRARPFVARIMTRPAFARAVRILERHPIGFILAFRWIYGIRTASPIAIGVSRIRSRRFVALNFVSAALWGPVLAAIGYAFGHAVAPWLHDLKWAILVLIAALLFVALTPIAWRAIRKCRRHAS